MTLKRPELERKAGIVEAALAEFLDKGYENSSMDSIARRAGLSKGGLYHHFRSNMHPKKANTILFETTLLFSSH